MSQSVVVGPSRSPAAANLMGVLGADVLSRFGAVRIDYQAQTLTLGVEGRPLEVSVQGRAARPKPLARLLTGTTQTVDMRVDVKADPPTGATTVLATVPVSVGAHNYQFTLDTGAAITAVDPVVAHRAGLARLNTTNQVYAGLACRVTVSYYQIPAWRLGTVSLGPAAVSNLKSPGGGEGLFGSGTLQQYDPIVVDFAHGELFLGPIHPIRPTN